ncbi:MAG TPA: hypothetical protein VLD67_11980 [Vicinamibacterales bacterium]|nr:hypothetical protein [Vicinamibacterales bacterium]
MDPLVPLLRRFHEKDVRFVVIGVAGINYYATGAGTTFTTRDRDLLLPLDPEALLRAWTACDELALSLAIGEEPLDVPRDRWLAERVISTRSVVRATNGRDLDVDLSVLMAGHDFEHVWAERRIFLVEGVEVPVARLEHIVRSKAEAGRPKDLLFLATHRDALKQIFAKGE